MEDIAKKEWHLHSCEEWENARPESVKFEQMMFKNKKVTKVIGIVIMKGGRKVQCHWDGFGICYVTDNKVYQKGRVNFCK